jgi:hypothetical protein
LSVVGILFVCYLFTGLKTDKLKTGKRLSENRKQKTDNRNIIMNNIQKPHILVYVGLILILVVLVILVSMISLPQTKKPNNQLPITNIPISKIPITNNQSQITPTISYPAPTGTGASEEIPKTVEDLATQKQNLKKTLPLQQADFQITFDYTTDKFVVTLSEPQNTSKQNFFTWLKKNYPLISIDKFVFEQ